MASDTVSGVVSSSSLLQPPFTAHIGSKLGWVSIACWIVVYTPQIIENYSLQTGEGLSVAFVVVWLLGDLFNLFGALGAGLIPTVIILAIYYSLCDIVLLVQIYYYRLINPVHPVSRDLRAPPNPSLHAEAGEEFPLLGDRAKLTHSGDRARRVLGYILAVLFICGVGIVAGLLSPGEGKDRGRDPQQIIEWRSQTLGWASAILYLAARVPQLAKNIKTKCEGLSIALFVFAIAGNTTYVLSICTKSMQWNYLVANAAWLAGSGLTVILDVLVLAQFYYYRTEGRIVSDGTFAESE